MSQYDQDDAGKVHIQLTANHNNEERTELLETATERTAALKGSTLSSTLSRWRSSQMLLVIWEGDLEPNSLENNRDQRETSGRVFADGVERSPTMAVSDEYTGQIDLISAVVGVADDHN